MDLPIVLQRFASLRLVSSRPSRKVVFDSRINTRKAHRHRFHTIPSRRADVAATEPINTSYSIQAAPPIDFSELPPALAPRNIDDDAAKKLRIVPASAAYFSGTPTFIDDLVRVQNLMRKYQALPTVKATDTLRRSWSDYDSYKSGTGKEPIRRSRFLQMTIILKRLSLIHPEIMPQEVRDVIKEFSTELNPLAKHSRGIIIDEHGRARAHGRRKASTARVWLVEGDGEVLVNGKPLADAFTRVHDRESVIWPLKSMERIDKYNVFAVANGGGTTGQAEAITLALTNALLAHEPMLKPYLRKVGVVANDPRRVERKKHGRVKARKMPTWVKR